MEKIREDEAMAHEPSHTSPMAAQATPSAGCVANSELGAMQRKMEDIEISLRSISHDFMTMFVESGLSLSKSVCIFPFSVSVSVSKSRMCVCVCLCVCVCVCLAGWLPL